MTLDRRLAEIEANNDFLDYSSMAHDPIKRLLAALRRAVEGLEEISRTVVLSSSYKQTAQRADQITADALADLVPPAGRGGEGMKRYTVSQREALKISRRVLRLVRGYLLHAHKNQDLLITDGKGLMTWAEIGQHVSAALALRVKR